MQADPATDPYRRPPVWAQGVPRSAGNTSGLGTALICAPCRPLGEGSLAAWSAGKYENWQANTLAAPVEQARRDAELLASRQVELAAMEAKMKNLTKLGQEFAPPPWDQLLADVGGCLPAGTWLESLKVDRNGTVYLFGPAFKPNAIYELVEQLKQVPSLREVVLEGTRPARLDSGPATLFDVKCVYAGEGRTGEGF